MSTQKFEIWCEGDSNFGVKSKPIYMGTVRGNSFEDACYNQLHDNKYYDAAANTHAGSRLFASKLEAMFTLGSEQ
jgi:hypothetical protein